MTPAKEKKPWQPPGLSCCLRAVVIRGPVYAGPGSHLPGGHPVWGKSVTPSQKRKSPGSRRGFLAVLGGLTAWSLSGGGRSPHPWELKAVCRSSANRGRLGWVFSFFQMAQYSRRRGWPFCRRGTRQAVPSSLGPGSTPSRGRMPRFAATSSRAASKVGAERNRAPKPRVV